MKQQLEKINCFVGTPLTTKQWNILFQGIGCPKNTYFWQALQSKMIIKGIGTGKHTYTLAHPLSEDEYQEAITCYRKLNNLAVKKHYAKKKAQQEAFSRMQAAKKGAKEAFSRMHSVCFFIVNGVLTTEKPERD